MADKRAIGFFVLFIFSFCLSQNHGNEFRVTGLFRDCKNPVGYVRIPGTNFFPISAILIHMLTHHLTD